MEFYKTISGYVADSKLGVRIKENGKVKTYSTYIYDVRKALNKDNMQENVRNIKMYIESNFIAF